MTRTALISALVIGVAAPAFASSYTLGVVSPAELSAEHDFETDFRASNDLGKESPAEIAGNDFTPKTDVLSTQDVYMIRALGVTSPAELAALE